MNIQTTRTIVDGTQRVGYFDVTTAPTRPGDLFRWRTSINITPRNEAVPRELRELAEHLMTLADVLDEMSVNVPQT